MLLNPSDFLPCKNKRGIKYKAWKHINLPVCIEEDSRMSRNLRYEPSGFCYVFINGNLMGSIGTDYCFNPETAIKMLNNLPKNWYDLL